MFLLILLILQLLILLYLVRWTNGHERGSGNWPAFRTSCFWRPFSPVAEWPTLEPGRCIYLIAPCASYTALWWSVGTCMASDVHYMLPWYLFWVPFLRDILVWSGAIVQDEQVLLDALGKNRGVCYALPPAPQGRGAEDSIAIHLPSQWLLDMAIRERIPLRIITVQGEEDQYFSLGWLGYWRRPSSFLCAQHIRLYAGVIIQSHVYQTASQLSQALAEKIQHSTILALGDKIIKCQ